MVCFPNSHHVFDFHKEICIFITCVDMDEHGCMCMTNMNDKEVEHDLWISLNTNIPV